MAVAEILEHLGDGKYRAQVVCHREWIPPLMEATQKRIDFYEEAIADLLEEIRQAETELQEMALEMEKRIENLPPWEPIVADLVKLKK